MSFETNSESEESEYKEVDVEEEAGSGMIEHASGGRIRRFFATALIKCLPFLVQDCLFGNQHWRWARLCLCGFGTIIAQDESNSDSTEEGWHGGILDLKLGHELQPCARCFNGHSQANHQWSLTDEEEHILSSWRTFRQDILTHFGKTHSYKYEITVNLYNGTEKGSETFLMSRAEGLNGIKGTRGIFADSVPIAKKNSNKPN